jgi:MFS family permease
LSTELDYASPSTTRGLREISGQQWKSATAAWLGWFFDGLDMHLYLLIAAPFVAQLLHAASDTDPNVTRTSGWIQAAFLAGWALGGAFFGRVGDLVGRSRALSLTILTYAMFTGLSVFAQTWWELLIFRFVAALGIGGEWAVGASLLSETWPSRWRPWLAAILQTAVNIGVLIACLAAYLLANHSPRYVFLVGIAPALIVFWIRRSVPETSEWTEARLHPNPGQAANPGIADLLHGPIRRTTILTIIVCAASLTAWWAFMFWSPQQITHVADVAAWSESARKRLASEYFFLIIGVSILGNFFGGWLAKRIGYRRAIAAMFVGFFIAMFGTYIIPRDHYSLLLWTPWVGFFSGVFGLFTMYLPPLFPTLLRTTGAGFSYNIGRLAAAAGTVIFGMFAHVEDFRTALLIDSLLFIPAMLVALMLPELHDH